MIFISYFSYFQSFHLSYQNENGSMECLSKISGFTLGNAMTKNAVNTEVFRKLLNDAIDNKLTSVPLDHTRKYGDKQSNSYVRKLITFHLKNRLMKKRHVLKSSLNSLPFGYSQNLLSEFS